MREAANVLERRPHAIPAPVEERRAGRVNEIRIRKYCPTCFASGRDQVNGGVMARDQLRDQHSLDLVARLYANNSGERRLCLTPPLIEIVGLTPQNKGDLINEEVGEIGTVGAADRLLSGGGNFADYYLCPRRRSFSRRCGSLGRSRSGARAINWFSL